MNNSFRNANKISKKIFSLATRIKLRHFKMGFPTLFKLAKWHLFGGQVITNSAKGLSWLVHPPTISILLTVHNQSAKELDRSIGSARAQHGNDYQILIVDDGSTNEETTRYLQNFESRSNEKIFFEPNQGVVRARNFLIAKTTTDYLVFLDPDDELEEQYLSRVLDLLVKSRHLEIVYPNVLIHDVSKDTFEIWGTGPFNSETLSKVNMIPMSSVVSVKLLKSLGGFSEDFQSGFEDWDLWYRASLCDPITTHLPEIGYHYTKAPISRTSIMVDNSDLIYLRGAGPASHFPFSQKGQIDLFLIIPFLPRIGGVERYVKALASDIKNQGLKVAIVITESDPFAYIDDTDSFRNQGNIVIKRSDFPNSEFFLQSLRTLSNPNSISINFGAPWVFENLIAFNSVFAKNIGFVFNSEISQKRVQTNASYFDEIWVAYEEIITGFPENQRNKIYTIYTGIVDESEPIRGFRIPDEFNVGFLGRLSVEKAPEKFLQIAFLARNEENLKFKIGGEGPLERTIKNQAKSMKNVSYEGFIEDTQDFLSTLDCLLITSDVEGIPLVAMEALSLGVPIASTNVGGMHELITSEEQGLIWNGSVEEGFDAVLAILDYSKIRSNVDLLDTKFWRSNTSKNVLERIKKLRSI